MEYILTEVHEEYAKRVEGELARLEQRIEGLETAVERQTAIVRAVDKLALNMEQMLAEQKAQGKRLDAIEGRDGELWRKVVGHMATAVAGAVIGYVCKQIGM